MALTSLHGFAPCPNATIVPTFHGAIAINPHCVLCCRLPYRMIFAVATEDAVLLYDTQQPRPFAFFTNIHYHQLSDITWYVPGRSQSRITRTALTDSHV